MAFAQRVALVSDFLKGKAQKVNVSATPDFAMARRICAGKLRRNAGKLRRIAGKLRRNAEFLRHSTM